MKYLHAYLTFDGQCEEAFNFYQSVFGGEIAFSGRFKDMPAEYNVPESQHNRVMHTTLAFENGTRLMGSDTLEGKCSIGNNFSLSIDTESKAEADRLFEQLSEEGEITMPIQNTFWNSYFGTCKDKFGVQWMVSYNLDEQSA